uniref:uncharacterized protein C17orf80 homolog n=1 Tax=Doryrhamphus excisus TaxID=161450 RepID=UPI0025AE2388|nr:uncharacterized protein C17orf80 homolog [Doryrhamphus excisus]XP_057924261.1 uncharacterized protein C17orf80 homolog [Doryrhamphus excisus]
MNREVCPFCGNSYKRLKSHLPHCKAAPKPPLTPDDPAASQTANRLDAGLPPKKSSTLKKKEVPKKSVKSPPPSSSSLKKQKLSEEKQMSRVSLSPSPSSSSRPKKSNRASIQAAKPNQFSFLQSDPQRSTPSKSAYKPDIPSTKKKPSQIQSMSPAAVERVDLWRKEMLQEAGSGDSPSRITLQHVGSIQTQTHRPGVQRCHAHGGTLPPKALAASNQAPSGSTLSSRKATPLPDHQATPPPHTVDSLISGLRHRAQLPSAFLDHHQEPSRAEVALKTQRTTDSCSGRGLGQVTLRELPGWLAVRTPRHPRDVVEMMQTGWGWYYRRYIGVRKGSIGGVGMLLAGYCVLSYIWSYPRLKRDCWRKYH